MIVAVRLVSVGFGLLVFFYICGAGLTKFLAPARLKSNEVLLAPLVGVAVFIMLGYAFSYAGLGARAWIWLVILTVTAIYAGAGRAAGWRIGFSTHEHLLPLLLTAGVFVIGVAPLVHVGNLTNIGTTGDVVRYCFPAEYLLDHGLPSASLISPTNPLNAINYEWFPQGARLGTNILVAGVDSFFGLESYQVFLPLISFVTSLAVLSVWVLCRNGLGLDRFASRLAVVALAVGNILYWGSYDAFLAQQLSLFLIPGMIAVGFALLDKPEARTGVLAAVLLAPLFASYEFALVYPVGALGLWFMIRLWRGHKMRRYLAPLAAFGGSSALLNVFVFIRRGWSLPGSAGSPEFASALSRFSAGNIRYYTSLSELLGLKVHQHSRVLPLAGLTGWPHYGLAIGLLTAAVVGLMLIGLYKTDAETRWKIIAITAPFVAVAALTRYLTFPYAYYKNIALAEPFIIIALSLGAAAIVGVPAGARQAVPRLIKVGAIIIMLGFFGFNFYSLALHEGYILDQINHANRRIVTPSRDVVSLRSRLPATAGRLMIGANVPDAQQLWMLYFLADRDLRLEKPSVYLRNFEARFSGHSGSEFAIYSTGYRIGADGRWNPQPVWENDSFELYERAGKV